MEKDRADILNLAILFISLLSAALIVCIFRASLSNSKMEAIATFVIVTIMICFFFADIIGYFVFNKIAPNFQRYKDVHLNKRLCNIWRTIRKLPVVAYFFIGLLLKLLIGMLTPNLSNEGVNSSIAEGASISIYVVVVMIITPLLETLVFQVMPIEISNRITIKCTGKPCVLFSITISALLFAIEHRFSIEYMCFAFVLGLYLAFFYSFSFRVYGKNRIKGFAMTALLHFIFNIIAFAAIMILNSKA